EIGRGLDFVSREPPPPDLGRFGALHAAYSVLDVLKLLLGIWLTGFNTVHWVLYLPAAFFISAAVTGICPGMGFSRLLFPPKK
ncbi:MAG: hypothetical protein AAB329_06470, partial [Pseudomonadota bacterium]